MTMPKIHFNLLNGKINLNKHHNTIHDIRVFHSNMYIIRPAGRVYHILYITHHTLNSTLDYGCGLIFIWASYKHTSMLLIQRWGLRRYNEITEIPKGMKYEFIFKNDCMLYKEKIERLCEGEVYWYLLNFSLKWRKWLWYENNVHIWLFFLYLM